MATPNICFRVLLFSEQGLDKKHGREVAAWFQRFPGPINVEVIEKPVKLERTLGTILWDETFSKLRDLRAEIAAESEAFVYLLTQSPNEQNWYAVEDEDNYRNGFGHVGDFSWVTSAPSHAISVHYIQKTIFNALLRDRNFPVEEIWHDSPRGCMFDFCAHKEDLAIKFRSADICSDCMSVFQEIPIPDELIHQTVSIMEAVRKLSVNTAPYLSSEHVFDRWPFPVALTRHKVVQSTNSLLRLLLLLDHYDSLVRYFYLAKETVAERRPELADHPSMGWWLDQLAASLKGERNFREVVRIAQEGKVVHLRNERRGHGWISPETESYRRDAEHLEGVITEIEAELAPFLEGYCLVIPREITLVSNQYRVEGENLLGSISCIRP